MPTETLTVGELRRLLEDLDPAAEVRLAVRPWKPLPRPLAPCQYRAGQVAKRQTGNGPVVWIVEAGRLDGRGDDLPYLPEPVREQLVRTAGSGDAAIGWGPEPRTP